MRIVVQRVRKAKVDVDGREVGSIGKGLLLLVGIHTEDEEEQVEWMCKKIKKLRIFDDDEGKMNLSVQDVEGELLVVSQFTLYGDAEKGNRPSYIESAGPEKAKRLYKRLINCLRKKSDINVETGIFGAYMDVKLLNDGPVTIILDR